MRTKQDRRISSVIIFTAAMLTVSLMTLSVRLSENGIPVEAKELYPNLYAQTSGVFTAPEQPTIYFTFDDGPSKNTERILDILKKEGIKATFFVTSQNEDKEEAIRLLQRMRDEGHTIGLHTYSHDYKELYNSLDAYLSDLDKINNFIIEATGVKPVLMRHPGGSRTRNCPSELMKQIVDELTRRGYIFHDWTVVSGDDGAKAIPAEDIVANVLKGLRGRQVEVLLFHDNPTPTTTPDAVAQLITELRRQGYTFDRLTENTPPEQLLKNTAKRS